MQVDDGVGVSVSFVLQKGVGNAASAVAVVCGDCVELASGDAAAAAGDDSSCRLQPIASASPSASSGAFPAARARACSNARAALTRVVALCSSAHPRQLVRHQSPARLGLTSHNPHSRALTRVSCHLCLCV